MTCKYYQELEEDFDVFEEYCEKYDEYVSCAGNIIYCPYDNDSGETEYWQ